MNFNSRNSTKGLKKIGDNLWYDKTSDSTFRKKKNGQLEMIVDDFERKMHKQTMERIRYYEKKYNTSMKQERERESKRWKAYTDSVKQWNNGEISRANTVGRKRKIMYEYQKDIRHYYSSENTQLSSDMTEKKKVFAMRVQGNKGVYNGGLYDIKIQIFAKRLGMSKEEVEKIMFPKGLEEKSKYDDMKRAIDKGFDTIEDIIQQKYENNEINKSDKIHLMNMLLGGDITEE